ncbi:MAG: adenosylcobalamin-dependent ribonucleoside-diphosphate reductase [Pseudomonadota bacterium]
MTDETREPDSFTSPTTRLSSDNSLRASGGLDADGFLAPISKRIWSDKYQLRDADGPADVGPMDTFSRVAETAALGEQDGVRGIWAQRLNETLSGYRFIPAGRILAGAGSGRQVTLFNCFVMGTVPDSLDGIFETLKQSAQTMQTGGGIGVDFSTLRPRGALVSSIGAEASGPVSFMEVWDAMCRTIMSAGARRGAMMATLRADHPDIEDFISAKTVFGRLTNFNLSVLVPDALMAAVDADTDWPLSFGGTHYRTVRARDLWDKIMRATYEASEPGVIFIDRINEQNNLNYCEEIFTTNPCGEQPLPPFGACLLGSFNLARYIAGPFTDGASLDLAVLKRDVHVAVRMLDNLIDISHYPLDAQKHEAISKRRMGLGVTGLADALIFVGKRYDSSDAQKTAQAWMSFIQAEAYAASAALAAEKGPFPLYQADAMLASPNVSRLPKRVRAAIETHGLRNGCLTSIAPTGTISLLAGNASSGIEPVFDLAYGRQVLNPHGSSDDIEIEDYAYAIWRQSVGGRSPSSAPRPNDRGGMVENLPDSFVTASQLSPEAHLKMQHAVQPYVDSSISKTINCPETATFEDVKDIYRTAFSYGLKGCTTFRPSPLRGSVLSTRSELDEPAINAVSGDVTSLDAPALADRVAVDIASPVHTPASNDAQVLDHREGSGPGAAQQAPRLDRSKDVVYMSKPLSRARALAGVTYKLKWPDSDHAIYVTLNDIETDGRRRPFEIFINTRNLEHYAWTVALTRMISAVFRRGGDVSFVAEELQAVFDPQGGQWIGGRYVPSLLAAIGDIIDEHLTAIGFYVERRPSQPDAAQASDDPLREAPDVGVHDLEAAQTVGASYGHATLPRSGRQDDVSQPRSASERPRNRACPMCGSAGLERRDGCWSCAKCGYSKCD